MLDLFSKAILSGIFISVGGIINLKIGGPLGAFLFSFGLLSVVHYSLPLFTGKAGFCKYSQDFKTLPLILIGNIIGTFIIGVCTHLAYPELIEKAEQITLHRQETSILVALFSSFMCGLIMTTVVKFARQKKFIPLLVGVPLFILAGFWHSIADAFYYSVSWFITSSFWYIYLVTVIGNFIGCNTYNLLVNKSFVYKEDIG
jgi:formate/nitrite transporter FocA (FNT family)